MTNTEIEIHKTLYNLAKEIDGCIEYDIRVETDSTLPNISVNVTVPVVSGKGVVNFYAESCYDGGSVLEFCKQMLEMQTREENQMNVEIIKVYLKKLTENTGNFYSFCIFSDGSGSLRDIRGEEILSWDSEDEMYPALLSMCTPAHCAKETLLNFLGESK